MFRFCENLVDPYGSHEEKDTPRRRLLRFLMEYIRPFRNGGLHARCWGRQSGGITGTEEAEAAE